MTTTNEEKIAEELNKYQNKWVAVTRSYDRVLASGSTLESVLSKVKDKKSARFFRVLPTDVIYSPQEV